MSLFSIHNTYFCNSLFYNFFIVIYHGMDTCRQWKKRLKECLNICSVTFSTCFILSIKGNWQLVSLSYCLMVSCLLNLWHTKFRKKAYFTFFFLDMLTLEWWTRIGTTILLDWWSYCRSLQWVSVLQTLWRTCIFLVYFNFLYVFFQDSSFVLLFVLFFFFCSMLNLGLTHF